MGIGRAGDFGTPKTGRPSSPQRNGCADRTGPARAGEPGGVEDDPVLLAVGRGRERRVPRRAHPAAALEDRLGLLPPRRRGEQVAVDRGREQPQAVVVGPASGRRVDQEHAIAPDDRLGPLVDRRRSRRDLPRKRRLRDLDPGAADRPGVRHRRDVKLLAHVDVPLPAGPDEVKLFAHAEHGAVDRPAVGLRVEDPRLEPELPLERVVRRVLKRVHAVVGVLPVVGGDVDVPLALQEVDLRRPQLLAVRLPRRRLPDHPTLRAAEPRNRLRPPQRDARPGRVDAVIPAVVVADHPGVGPLGRRHVVKIPRLAGRRRQRPEGGRNQCIDTSFSHS